MIFDNGYEKSMIHIVALIYAWVSEPCGKGLRARCMCWFMIHILRVNLCVFVYSFQPA